MNIILRKFNKETDLGFLYGSVTKGIYFGSLKTNKNESLQDFTQRISPYLEDLIETANILIACSQEDPTFLIGYSIIKGGKLEWIFVKKLYRRQNIAIMLSKKATSYNENNMTNIAMIITKRKKLNEQNARELN